MILIKRFLFPLKRKISLYRDYIVHEENIVIQKFSKIHITLGHTKYKCDQDYNICCNFSHNSVMIQDYTNLLKIFTTIFSPCTNIDVQFIGLHWPFRCKLKLSESLSRKNINVTLMEESAGERSDNCFTISTEKKTRKTTTTFGTADRFVLDGLITELSKCIRSRKYGSKELPLFFIIVRCLCKRKKSTSRKCARQPAHTAHKQRRVRDIADEINASSI